MADTIPAFLTIDCEPDGFQAPSGDGWSGAQAHFEWAEDLRRALGERTGRTPRFSWCFRMDPQIGVLYGTPEHAARAFAAELARCAAAGDAFGLHVHPLRYDDDRAAWIHDFASPEWNDECIEYARDAYVAAFGEPPRRYRHGAAYLDDRVIEAAERIGVAVDLTMEPIRGWGLHQPWVDTGVDSSPSIGTFVDCVRAPRVPYHPSRGDFRRPDPAGHQLVIVPLSASPLLPEKSWWWRAARRLRTPPARQRARMLQPSGRWPSPEFFWDVVSDHLDGMVKPYLSFVVRTEAPESATARRVFQVFEALPAHPIAERLDFADPVAVAPTLTEDRW